MDKKTIKKPTATKTAKPGVEEEHPRDLIKRLAQEILNYGKA